MRVRQNAAGEPPTSKHAKAENPSEIAIKEDKSTSSGCKSPADKTKQIKEMQ